MSVDKESLKRVLLGIKGAARGFRKDKLQARLKPQLPPEGDDQLDPSNPLEAEPDPLDPNEPAEMAAGEAPEDMDAATKLEAIRKLIGSV